MAKEILGSSLCDKLLLLHAFTGCDTTSRIFHIGKSKIMKKHNVIQQSSDVFYATHSTHEEVSSAGEAIFKVLYCCSKACDLNEGRLHKFCEKVASSTTYVEPQSLPPTSESARFHSLRVFHQVQAWFGHAKDALNWGWKFEDSKYTPIMFLQPPAQKYLMEAMHCNCKTGCQSNKCTCRRHGLP